jgi:hypothetical protein
MGFCAITNGRLNNGNKRIGMPGMIERQNRPSHML